MSASLRFLCRLGAYARGVHSNSAVDTGETASSLPGQIQDFHVSPPVIVNPYLQERRPPKMGRDGCSTSIRKERGARDPGVPP